MFLKLVYVALSPTPYFSPPLAFIKLSLPFCTASSVKGGREGRPYCVRLVVYYCGRVSQLHLTIMLWHFNFNHKFTSPCVAGFCTSSFVVSFSFLNSTWFSNFFRLCDVDS
uniref:Uncharacterized protein n=1 Tax=Cacopsylla melanoneura TaxID=428564 RepID=A0A8D8X7B4_9HEMI